MEPPAKTVTYVCLQCSARNENKVGEVSPMRCTACGYRILRKQTPTPDAGHHAKGRRYVAR